MLDGSISGIKVNASDRDLNLTFDPKC